MVCVSVQFQLILCNIIFIKDVWQFIKPHLDLIYFVITYFNEVLNARQHSSCYSSLLDKLCSAC